MINQTASNDEHLAEIVALRRQISQLQQRLVETEAALARSQQAKQIFPAASPELFHLLSLLSDYVYVIEITEDEQWRTVYLSPQFETLTGYPIENLQADWSLWSSKIINADDRAALSAQMMRISAGQGSEVEYRLTRADNQIIWVHDRVRVQVPGTPKLVYGIVSDITESKLRETSLAQLLDVSRALVATHNPNQVLDQAIKAVVKIVPTAVRGSLQLLDEAGETLHTVATSTAGESLGNTLIFRPGTGIAGHALGKNQVINVADTLSDKRFVFSNLPLRDRSLLVAPLIVKKRLVGTLSLSSELLNAFSPAHEALIQLISDQVAAALENARLFEIQFRTEKELRRSEKFLQSTIDALALQLAILDESGRVIALNAAWQSHQQEDATAQSFDTLRPTLNLCDSDMGMAQEIWSTISDGIRLVTSGERSQFYLEYACHNEVRKQWYGVRITRFYARPSFRVVIAREDVTERKLAEQALRTSEAQYRTLTNQLAVGIYRITEQGQFLLANRTLAEILGYADVAELMSISIPDIYYQSHDRILWLATCKADLVATQEHQFKQKDGTVIWVRDTGRAILDEAGQIEYIDGVVEDITPRRMAQQALQKSEANLRAIFESSQQAYFLIEPTDQMSLLDPYRLEAAALPEKGEAPSSATGWDITEFKAYIERAFEGEFVTTDYRSVNSRGRDSWFEFNFMPVYNDEGQITCVCMSSSDISARRHSEEQLRLLAAAIGSTEDGVLIIEVQKEGSDPEIVFVNEGYCQMTGLEKEALLGQVPEIVDFEKVDVNTYRAVRAAIANEQSFRGQTVGYYRDKAALQIAWLLSPIHNVDGQTTHFVAICRDVTELKLLEAQLQQSQKMEAIGRLAGGVAHDFNNLLTAIKGYSQLILDQLDSDSPLREDVDQIRQAGDRAAALSSQLLAFSRQEVVQPKALSLNSVIHDMEKMVSRLIGEHVQLITDLAPDLGTIKADPSQMGQIILNLVINARDAMPLGGTIRIYTQSVRWPYPDQPFPTKSCVLLRVCDNGHGIDEDTLTHIFDPFFTTKESGRNSGIGLATVRNIVLQNEGEIKVESTLEAGTQFSIYFPQIAPAMENVEVVPSRSSSAEQVDLHGSETLLLVEDEVLVRQFAHQVLRQHGYEVLQAQNGDEAVLMSEMYEANIDLLLTDIVMPGGLSGRRLAEKLSAQRPAMKVVYMSGYTEDIIVRHGVLNTQVSFLQKPFEPATLIRKIREALDKEGFCAVTA